MKAAIYCGPHDIQVADVPKPEINANEILVRVKACGICGSDLHAYRIGLFEDSLGRPTEKGLIMGHEFSGEVVETGRDVQRFRVGDHISGGGLGGLDMARQLGADEIVNLTEVDPVEAVIELTGGERPVERFGARGGNADVVIDSAGAKASPNQGLTMLKQQNGRLVPVALFEDQPELDFNQVVRKQVTLQGSWSWTPDDYMRGIELVRTGKIDREPLVSHAFPLDQAPEAFATQAKPGAAIKTLIKP